ncbi:PLD nuclease N-terminal domain-containing protein [Psychroserpens sp.]
MSDILKSSFEKNNKIIWILVVLLVPILGSILYIFIGRKQKLKLN